MPYPAVDLDHSEWDDPDYQVLAFRGQDGDTARRSARSFDLRGDHLPQFNLMAFPGEEPPQIECNEDAASGEEDD